MQYEFVATYHHKAADFTWASPLLTCCSPTGVPC